MLLACEGLEGPNAATTIRVAGDGRHVTDGPFMETKEQLGGFIFMEVRDLDEAMEWAARTPWNGEGNITEIRPVHGSARTRRGAQRRGERGDRRAVERVFREHFGRAVAALIRSLGDWDLAEEAVQDAFATALERWPRDGVPRDPAAWIVAVARNRAIDRVRRERVLRTACRSSRRATREP